MAETFIDDDGVEYELEPAQSLAPKAPIAQSKAVKAEFVDDDEVEYVIDDTPVAKKSYVPAERIADFEGAEVPEKNFVMQNRQNRSFTERFADSLKDSMNYGFVGLTSRKINDWVDTGKEQLKKQYPGQTEDWYEEKLDDFGVQVQRDLREKGAQAQAADPNWRPDESFIESTLAGRWLPWFAGQVVGSVGPEMLLSGGTSALGRVGAQAAIGGVSDLGYQGLDVAAGVADEISPEQVAISTLASGGFQGLVEGAKGIGRAMSPDAPKAATEAPNPFSSEPVPPKRMAPEEEQSMSEIFRSGDVEDIIAGARDRGFAIDRKKVEEWVQNRTDDADMSVRYQDTNARKTPPGKAPGMRPSTIPREEIDYEIKYQTADWKNSPEFEVVDDWKQISDPEVRQSMSKAANRKGVKGFVAEDGRVYVFSKAIESKDELRALVFHEGLGHSGLSAKFGADLDNVLRELYESNDNFRAQVDEWNSKNPDAYGGDIARAADEVLAEKSEAGQINPGVMNVIRNKLKDWGRRAGVKLEYTDREIMTILGIAHSKIVDGDKLFSSGGTRFIRTRTPIGQDVEDENRFMRRRPGQAAPSRSDVLQEVDIDEVVDSLDFKRALDAINAARKGPRQTWEETGKLAEELNLSPKQAERARITYTPEQTEAFSIALRASEEKVSFLEERLLTGQDDARTFLDYADALATHVKLMDKYEGIKSQAGQLLNVLKKLKGETNELDNVEIRAMMAKINNGVLSSPAQMQQFAQNVAAMRKAGNKRGANAAAKALFKPKAEDYIFSLWYNSLLSSPATHGANMAGTGLNFMNDLVEQGLASVLGQTRRFSPNADRVMGREVVARIWGPMMALKDINTWKSTKEAFMTGQTAGQANSKTGSTNLVLPGKLTALETPTRALAAEDELFRNMIQLSNIYGLAVRNAGKKGLKGKAFWNEVSNLIKNPTKDMMDKSVDYAKVLQFLDEPSPIGKALNDFHQVRKADSVPTRVVRGAARIVLPFVRTPDALIRTAIRRMGPLGLLERENIKGMKGDAAAQDVVKARMLLGSAMAGYVAIQAFNNNITGSGPTDLKKKKEWEATHQANSIKIGNKWYSYAGLEPVSTALAVTASLVERMKETKDEDTTVFEDAAVSSARFAKVLAENSYTGGLTDFMSIFAEKDDNRALTRFENFAAGFTSSAVPAIVRQYNQSYEDDKVRNTTGDGSLDDRVSGRIKSAIPGASKELPQQYDVYGREKVREGSLGWDMASRIREKTVESNPTIVELERLSTKVKTALVPPVDKTITVDGEKVKLNAEQYETYQQLAGSSIVAAVEEAMAGEEWEGMSDGERVLTVKSIGKEQRKAARQYLFEQEEDE